MKLRDFTSMSPLEIIALVLFVIYVIVPFKTPGVIADIMNGPLGILILLIITMLLFTYTNPILGVVYIFVAYEVLRRSALVNTPHIVNATHNERKKQNKMVQLNPETTTSLEESVIAKMAPAQQFNSVEAESPFLPVVEKIPGTSLYKK
jgi:hypothetical protein